jgi:predicted DNA-binding WGR domain protein
MNQVIKMVHDSGTKFYNIYLGKDLFNKSCITAEYGSLRTSFSQIKHYLVKKDIDTEKQRLINKKIKRGYRLVRCDS